MVRHDGRFVDIAADGGAGTGDASASATSTAGSGLGSGNGGSRSCRLRGGLGWGLSSLALLNEEEG